MPYAPGIQPRGDQYLFAGISQFGEGLGKSIQNFVQAKRESEFLDKQVVSLAAAMKPLIEAGDIQPEVVQTMEKFPGMSLSQKRGAAASMVFALQSAKEAKQEAQAAEDRTFNRSVQSSRLTMEAERLNRDAQDRARTQAGREQFNVGLGEYLDTPEMLRRPAAEAIPSIAARAGVADPEMAHRFQDARLRDAELAIRDRAVAVQERNAGVAEGKLDLEQLGGDKPKPEAVQRMMNEVILRLSDPVRSPMGEEKKALEQRLKDLTEMLPASMRPKSSAGGGRVKVISPDGKTRGSIPESQLEAALKEGYTRAD